MIGDNFGTRPVFTIKCKSGLKIWKLKKAQEVVSLERKSAGGMIKKKIQVHKQQILSNSIQIRPCLPLRTCTSFQGRFDASELIC